MTREHHAGKGDSPRKVDGETYRQNHDAIFKKRESLACKNGIYSQNQEAEFYRAHNEYMKGSDFDSHDETTYHEQP